MSPQLRLVKCIETIFNLASNKFKEILGVELLVVFISFLFETFLKITNKKSVFQQLEIYEMIGQAISNSRRAGGEVSTRFE